MTAPPWTQEELAILRARTKALAQPLDLRAPRVERTAFVRVVASGERFAVAAPLVRAVAPLTSVAAVPLAPPELTGLVSHGGELVPVFDLRRILGLRLRALPERARIVLLDDPLPVALVVDAVEQAEPSGTRPLEAHAESLPRDVRAWFTEECDDGVPVLDVRALLASTKLVVDVTPPNEALPDPTEDR